MDKDASAENTFEHFVNAIVTGNTSYYQEVIGRTMTEEEIDEFKPYVGKKPTIAKIVKSKNHAYVVTDSNWGQHFEKVKGRWVFTPEDYGVLVRDIFK